MENLEVILAAVEQTLAEMKIQFGISKETHSRHSDPL